MPRALGISAGSAEWASPFRSFTLALAMLCVLGAVVGGWAFSQAIERLFTWDTQSLTVDGVALHFRAVFPEDVFHRPLDEQERARFSRTVRAHLDLYRVVQLQLIDRANQVVFSYEPAEWGRRLSPELEDRVRRAFLGETVVARTALPPEAAVSGQGFDNVLAITMPVVGSQSGRPVGAAIVYRDDSPVVEALRRAQFALAVAMLLVFGILFLLLRRVYLASARRIREQEAARGEAAARAAAMEEIAIQKGQFVGIVSHELRSPLTYITANAELLLFRSVDPQQAREMLGEIHREAMLANRIVDDLLDLTRLEAGRFTLSPRPVDAAALLVDAAASARASAPSHSVERDWPADLPAVLADADRVRQVLANLIGNAARYSPPGSRIRIAAEARDGKLHVSVADEGPGIAPEDRERIFDPFYRSALTADRDARGAGLGLAVARGFVDAHGGEMGVESQAGVGSRFWFTLPLATQRAVEPAEPAAVSSGRQRAA